MNRSNKIAAGFLCGTALLAGVLVTWHYRQADGHREATTRFRILARALPDVGSFANIPEARGGWFENQIRVLDSHENLHRVVKDLGLDVKWNLPRDIAVRNLAKTITVTAARDSDVIEVTAWSATIEDAAAIADAVRHGYEEHRQNIERERMRRSLDNVAGQIRLQKKMVEKAHREMLDLMKKPQITFTDGVMLHDLGLQQSEERPFKNYIFRPRVAGGRSDGLPEWNDAERQKYECLRARNRYESASQLLNSLQEYWQKADPGVAETAAVEVLQPAH